MVLSDFLSGQKHDDSNPHEIIPIVFNMQVGKYLVQTRSQAKSSGISLPEVYGICKRCQNCVKFKMESPN